MRGKMESENNHLHLKTTTMLVLCLGHDQRFTIKDMKYFNILCHMSSTKTNVTKQDMLLFKNSKNLDFEFAVSNMP